MLPDGGGAWVYNRRTILTISFMAVLAKPAIADPFDWAPRNIGIAINDRLRSAGLDLHFELERCEGASGSNAASRQRALSLSPPVG